MRPTNDTGGCYRRWLEKKEATWYAIVYANVDIHVDVDVDVDFYLDFDFDIDIDVDDGRPFIVSFCHIEYYYKTSMVRP